MILLKDCRLLQPLTEPWAGEEADILIEADRIKAVDKQVNPGRDATIVPMEGRYVLPGLFDLHTHLDNAGIDYHEENQFSEAYRALKSACFARRTQEAGFTTVRDCGARNHADIALREAINEGYVPGPRLLVCGRVLTPTARGNEEIPDQYRVADGVDEVRKAAREQLAAGADFIKYMGTGAIGHVGSLPGAPTFNFDEVRVMVEEADKLGRQVAAHAHGTIGIKHALKARVRTIEHSSILDDECLELLKEGRSFIVPTLSAAKALFDTDAQGRAALSMKAKSQEIIETLLHSISRAYQAGLKIGFGADLGTSCNHHGLNYNEFRWRHDLLRMKPMDLLLQATRHSAEILCLDDRLGSVTPGKIADLIAVGRDPLADLSVMYAPAPFVMHDGRIIKN
ncbi:MAG: amidohydrolase family protein [Candidatus Adiutrix sp.]|jgi:imidazolonepropionase-like amidohydrolase|nr:amidohydrolase family protein [Candidatus Adiutrix sp.]